MNFNDDITKIRIGGRVAKRISVNEFKEKIFAFIDKYSPGELIYKNEFMKSNDPMNCRTKYTNMSACLFNAIQKDKIVSKDLSKIRFGYNLGEASNTENSHFLGLHVTESGLPFIGVYSCGDEEYTAVHYIIYFDGKNIRGYIPYYGNAYNPQTKAAFGLCNEDKDEQLLKTVGMNIYDVQEIYADEEKLLFDINKRIIVIQ